MVFFLLGSVTKSPASGYSDIGSIELSVENKGPCGNGLVGVTEAECVVRFLGEVEVRLDGVK